MKSFLAPFMLAFALLAGQDAPLASEPLQLAQAKSAPIDINRAKADELMTLEGDRRGARHGHHQGASVRAQG